MKIVSDRIGGVTNEMKRCFNLEKLIFKYGRYKLER